MNGGPQTATPRLHADNPELALAGEYVRDTACNVFLTGKAGTGKTTFLHGLAARCDKRMVITAPTGVAAINAGGVTLHSFFQLPFGPFVPGGDPRRSQYRFSRAKLDILRNLDLLVIDEVSMVRADLLDGVDSVLRRYRHSDRPFGGIQLLMIGDLFQLPPVVKAEEWQLLQQHYASPYFFSSRTLQQTDLVTIELKHIYRQVDSRFIDLLNRVRNNRVDVDVLERLNRRYLADVIPCAGDGTVTLCTHNRQADRINAERLDALSRTVHRFDATVEGEFPRNAFPTSETLQLKQGAQVMFMRNDPSAEKRYFNGKIGTISRIHGDEIRIRCPDESEEIVVEPVDWENIEYDLDRETLTINQKTIGLFRQYPLRLAWAITIHKSQGLTFDRAVIDAQAAFAHGQVYVALSRCRTLEGMVLSSPLPATSMRIDETVRRFSEAADRNLPSSDQLEAAKVSYQRLLLNACFDFQRLRTRLRRMAALVSGNATVVQVRGLGDIGELQQRTEAEICTVGDSFLKQLNGLFSDVILPAEDPKVIERISKASAYFEDKIASGLGRRIPGLRIDTDNKTLGKKIKRALKLLEEEIAVKLAAVRSCADGFSPSGYLRAVSGALTGGPGADAGKTAEPRRTVTYDEADITHHDLFERLRKWRTQKAADEGVPPYRVLHQKPLIQIAIELPDTLVALKSIKGIGDRLAERYGEDLIALVGAYRRENAIERVALTAGQPAERQRQKSGKSGINTRQATLELFEKGLSLDQIAERRALTRSTIDGHMAYWVEQGTVAVDALLAEDRRQAIQRVLMQMRGRPLGDIRRAMGPVVSYADIRFAKAHLDYLAASSED